MLKIYDTLKRCGSAFVATVFSFIVSVPVWASETGGNVAPADWSPIIEAMTGQISVSTVVGVIASAIGAGIGLVFMWWGARKAVKTLMAAFRKGKASI